MTTQRGYITLTENGRYTGHAGYLTVEPSAEPKNSSASGCLALAAAIVLAPFVLFTSLFHPAEPVADLGRYEIAATHQQFEVTGEDQTNFYFNWEGQSKSDYYWKLSDLHSGVASGQLIRK